MNYATLTQQVCVQHRTSAVNMTLPTLAPKRHAAAPLLLLSASACCIACQLGAQQQTRSSGGTDGHTDEPHDSYINPVLHTMSAMPIIYMDMNTNISKYTHTPI